MADKGSRAIADLAEPRRSAGVNRVAKLLRQLSGFPGFQGDKPRFSGDLDESLKISNQGGATKNTGGGGG